MKLSDLLNKLKDRMSFRDDILMDATFARRANDGITIISKKTIPMALTDSDPNGQDVLRMPLPHTYVLKHYKFDTTLVTAEEVDGEQEIQLEEELVDAVSAYMATLYEPQNQQKYYTQMWDVINDHRKMILDSPLLSDSESEYEHGFV
jgi:hypothetical protein